MKAKTTRSNNDYEYERIAAAVERNCPNVAEFDRDRGGKHKPSSRQDRERAPPPWKRSERQRKPKWKADVVENYPAQSDVVVVLVSGSSFRTYISDCGVMCPTMCP